MDDRLEPRTRCQISIRGVVNSTSAHAGSKGRATRQRNRVLGRFERLERRDLLSINIRFDYSMDEHGFFDDPLRRDILELAAETFEDRLGGFLSEIKPSGGNTWEIAIEHPATGEDTSRANLHIRENEVLVFAGGRDLEGNTLGRGGAGGYSCAEADRGIRPWQTEGSYLTAKSRCGVGQSPSTRKRRGTLGSPNRDSPDAMTFTAWRCTNWGTCWDSIQTG